MMDFINNAMGQTYYEHTLLQWTLAFLCIACSFMIGKLTKFLLEKTILRTITKYGNTVGEAIAKVIDTPVVLIVTFFSIQFALTAILDFNQNIDDAIGTTYGIILIFSAAWMLTGLCGVGIRFGLEPWVEKSNNELAQVLLPPLQNSLQFFIWFLALIVGISAAGYDVGAVLAGLGIGGLAVAMAARETLGDLLGGITLIITRPFKVGQLIEFDDRWVKVTDIGLRMTIAEDFANNAKIVIPNAQFFTKKITNFSAHPGFMVLMNVRLAIKTPTDKLERAIDKIGEIIDQHDRTRFIWIKLDHFDNYAFVIRLHYDILSFKERNKVKTEINLAITRYLRANDIGFSNLPLDVGSTAMTQYGTEVEAT